MHLPGKSSFPVRLGQEIFLRTAAITGRAALSVYDPCCGGAAHIAALGFLENARIDMMCLSDIDEQAVACARENLALLTKDGLLARRAALCELSRAYQKPSHAEAVAHVDCLAKLLARDILSTAFVHDITREKPALPFKPDLIFADVPYGGLEAWVGDKAEPLGAMLENLEGLLAPQGVLALITTKGQKPPASAFIRLARFKCGARVIHLLTEG